MICEEGSYGSRFFFNLYEEFSTGQFEGKVAKGGQTDEKLRQMAPGVRKKRATRKPGHAIPAGSFESGVGGVLRVK